MKHVDELIKLYVKNLEFYNELLERDLGSDTLEDIFNGKCPDKEFIFTNWVNEIIDTGQKLDNLTTVKKYLKRG